jgi:hypothetical protein
MRLAIDSSHVHTTHPPGRLLIGSAVFMALWALAGVTYALGGAEGVDRAWLDGSSFHNYVVPGLILGIAVGGSQAAAAISLWRRSRHARVVMHAAAAIVLIWIAVRVAIIGYVSALQPIVFAYGIVQLWLARRIAS